MIPWKRKRKQGIAIVIIYFEFFRGINNNDIPTLNKLEKYLNKGYKNVVFIILDGFGINPIKINLSHRYGLP